VIPRPNIVEWARRAGWPTDEQNEQDLVLSRLIVEIARDRYLGEELVFRGGTCLHKLHADKVYRYSEDLDYVRRTGGGIAEVTRSLTAIGERLGMEVRTQIAVHPKVHLRAPFESGTGRMQIKIEVNTLERSPTRGLLRRPYAVRSSWFSGEAEVLTFSLPELLATKLRALFQRSKGRDLFDLWLSLVHLDVAPADVVACFGPYRPAGYTRRRAEENLRRKCADTAFRDDLRPLVAACPEGYEVNTAAELIISRVLSLL
jgi:predicted nucleotidyltransferase component of viral defense system